jgi:trimeric autotransporter adhesin
VLVPIGALDPTAATVFLGAGEFDIAGGDDGLSVAALSATGATQSTLYRVNLKTGAVTSVGALGPAGSPSLTGLAIQLK